MYYYVKGNIFESPAQTLVNTVNTVGAMGKGLAKEFKSLFPDMFKEYQSLCESGQLNIGNLWFYKTDHKWVLNFPTKKHWRDPSKLEYVEAGLQNFIDNYNQRRITSVAFPKLGCGNGELDWSEVKPLMEKFLKTLPIEIYVYETNEYIFPEHRDIKRMREWLQKEPATYPFDEFMRDILQFISKDIKLYDMNGDEYAVFVDDNLIIFEQNHKNLALPFEGDESGSGLQELWQFFREKQICTFRDLFNMGYERPGLILGLLGELSYVQPIDLIGGNSGPAIQLKPNSRALSPHKDLFYQPQLL